MAFDFTSFGGDIVTDDAFTKRLAGLLDSMHRKAESPCLSVTDYEYLRGQVGALFVLGIISDDSYIEFLDMFEIGYVQSEYKHVKVAIDE